MSSIGTQVSNSAPFITTSVGPGKGPIQRRGKPGEKSRVPFRKTVGSWGPPLVPSPLVRRKVERLPASPVNIDELSRPATTSPSVSLNPLVQPTDREEMQLLPPRLAREEPLAKRDRKLMISNPKVAKYLLGQLPVLNGVLKTALQIEIDDGVDYGRDARVCLPTGEHYIPFEIPMNVQEHDQLSCMIPFEDDQAQGIHKLGKGFTEEYRKEAAAYAKKKGIPIKQNTRSCVEGGNCLIVEGKDGQHKAYVGYSSLLLTIMALEQQNYFKESEAVQFLQEYMSANPNPEEESFRVGYNLFSHSNRPGRMANNGRFNPCHKIYGQVPPGIMRQKNYIEAARLLEAKRELAKKIIAKDLGIPYENIIYLFQGQFHIDMENFATPDNVVFLHDDREALACLNGIRPLIEGEDLQVLEQYVQHAIERYKSTDSRNNRNKEILERAGCRAVLVGGDFQGKETRVNLMNGELLQNGESPLFLTNGTVNNALNLFLKAHFLGKVKKACPGLKVIFAADQTSLLQHELFKFKAGIHCITWMNSPSVNPNQGGEEEKKSSAS